MDDLVKRLRDGCSCNIDSSPCMAEEECRDAYAAAYRIEALEARVRAADALAEAAGELSLSKYGLKACRVRTALAAYRATKEGGAL